MKITKPMSHRLPPNLSREYLLRMRNGIVLLERISQVLLVLTLVTVCVGYGIWASRNDGYAARLYDAIKAFADDVQTEVGRHEMLSFDVAGPLARTYAPEIVQPGLLAISGMTDGPINFIRVIDREGTVVHEWQPDWFSIWGDEGDFPEYKRPRSQPGAIVHGFKILDDGSVVLNFEYLSTMRLSECGDVIWKLDNLGHHSIHLDEQDTLWVPSQTYYEDKAPPFPSHRAPLRSDSIQRITLEGQVIESVEVIDLFLDNDIPGWLFLSSLSDDPVINDDPIHLNDIETVPVGMSASFFKEGDVMLSLRNLNAIVIVEWEARSVKRVLMGPWVRQHDPDFIGKNQISVFDNRNIHLMGYPPTGSRILRYSTESAEVSVVPAQDSSSRFYSNLMGKHQMLENGNVLLVSSKEGRAIELTDSGRLVWEYNNLVSGGNSGLLTQAELLPEFMDRQWFEKRAAECSSRTGS